MTTTLAPADRDLVEAVKISLLSEGMRLSPDAFDLLSRGGRETLTIHEYPTTGGITMVLDGDVYVNAPFDEWYCARASARLEVDGGGLVLDLSGRSTAVHRVLPLPGYLGRPDGLGRPSDEVVMSHADRARLSPVVGCAYDCGFCDLPGMAYELRGADRLLVALAVAEQDTVLPVRHVLISGGSPRSKHYESFVRTCEDVIAASPLPVDVMFSPMVGTVDCVDRFVDAGAAGLSINIEVFSDGPARDALRAKYRTVRDALEATIVRAVERLGRTGRVRSLIIVGLEPPEETLRGVDYLASLGCDPVLSPFRPAEKTRLKLTPPPRATDLAEVLRESRAIVARHGVALGPDCAPCQHNTLSFPWDLRPGDGRFGPVGS